MTLPHLTGVEPAIAAKKLVAAGGLDYSHGCVGPGEEGMIVRDRRLHFLARVVSLFWRGHDFVSRNLGRAKLAMACALAETGALAAMMQPARTAWVLWRFIINSLRYEPGRRVKVAGRYRRAKMRNVFTTMSCPSECSGTPA
jgi:hypothetical protein